MNSAKLRGFLFFILLSFLCFNSCAQENAQNDFYRGLLSKAESRNDAAAFFIKSLNSSNVYIRRASAEELANLTALGGRELPPRTMAKVRRETHGYWAAATTAVGSADKGKVLAFLLGFEQGTAFPNEARHFVLRECEKRGNFFSAGELAAIEGHFSAVRSRYNEALGFFRAFQEEGEWPDKIPDLFLEYPGLINDLGRAFQYTSTGREGLELFLKWEENLTNETAPDAPVLSVPADEARYRLLFFAARIARRAGRTEQAVSLFERAQSLASEGVQSDACIWYILDLSLRGASNVFIQRLEQFAPYWHNAGYFDDVMEKFLQPLISQKDWPKIIRTFALIKNSGSSSTAAFAWVIARAIEEGLISGEELRAVFAAVNAQEADSSAATDSSAAVEALLRIAYNAGGGYDSSSLYYRSRSAAALEQPFFALSLADDSAAKAPAGRSRRSSSANRRSPALQFILGFFNNGAAEFSLRYIEILENELAQDELRLVAQAFAQAEMYPQSIRFVSAYINRDGFTPDRRDFELMFPRPYKELVEKYAAEHGIAPSLLFALIRTESAFQSGVVSRAGAVGLTQLMPATAQEMAGRIRRAGGPDYAGAERGVDLGDPSVNIHIGAYYLNYLTGHFEDNLVSLLAYNGGMNRVRRWRAANKLPVDLFMETITVQETRDYGRKVMGAAAVYEELYYSSR